MKRGCQLVFPRLRCFSRGARTVAYVAGGRTNLHARKNELRRTCRAGDSRYTLFGLYHTCSHYALRNNSGANTAAAPAQTKQSAPEGREKQVTGWYLSAMRGKQKWNGKHAEDPVYTVETSWSINVQPGHCWLKRPITRGTSRAARGGCLPVYRGRLPRRGDRGEGEPCGVRRRHPRTKRGSPADTLHSSLEEDDDREHKLAVPRHWASVVALCLQLPRSNAGTDLRGIRHETSCPASREPYTVRL